ncbi:MAG TPA: hexitol phosphatase HxpB [Acidimicrobiales bacterium]
MASLDAVIFDLDGVLIDSEPFWREAETARFAEVGLHVAKEETRATMGLRIDEAVAYWYARRPWPDGDDPDHRRLVGRILDSVEELVLTRGEPLPGALDAVDVCAKRGLRLAVASSSPDRIIAASLRRLGVADRFEVVRSAEHEAHGKPHPAVFLRTAEDLGVAPTRCLVVEDSFNGMVAALAARMRCVAVPEVPSPRFAAADRVVDAPAELPVALDDLLGELLAGAEGQA